MEEQKDDKLTCQVCGKNFCRMSSKNQHLKKFHNILPNKIVKHHIKCPLCSESTREPFGTRKGLIGHLKQFHTLDIIERDLYFGTIEGFEAWRYLENRGIDYACEEKKQLNDHCQFYTYNCNRSDTRGFVSKCTKKRMKMGGSIKISGMCPSRIQAKIDSTDGVNVHFVETHVGHEDELRSKRLTKSEEEMIHNKLVEGVTVERILKDVKVTQNSELTRLNILTRGDISYLIRKFNIDKKRHEDDMTATILKVEEWNNQEENQVFVFKKIGERHPELQEDDFALGYMNNLMERKLKEFKNIICIDGTHGTNQRKWDLTIVLIKDERNMGFPVAFLLANRLDQKIQKVFFQALKNKVGETIIAKYIMTDDDVKATFTITSRAKCNFGTRAKHMDSNVTIHNRFRCQHAS